MNVNQKIWLGFGSVLALVGIGASLGYRNSQTAERASTQLVRESLAAYKGATAAEALMATARIFEQRFINTRDEAEITRFNTTVGKLRTAIETVKSSSLDPRRDAAAEAIIAKAEAYAVTFRRVHQLYVLRGLKPDAGLEGQLRKAVHEVEARAKDLGHDELSVTMLMVRRHEKDYLLRGDPKYVADIDLRLKEFSAQMQKLGLLAPVQQDLNTRWSTYAAAINAVVSGDREIAAARAELLRGGNEIEGAVVALAASCSADIDTSQIATLTSLATGRRTTLLIGVISGVIGALMAVWIAFSLNSLNRGIRLAGEHIAGGSAEILGASIQLKEASHSLAEGSTQQAAALEETSASLEEMSSMTTRNATSAARAKTLASQTRTAAETGATDMAEMKRAMDDIKTSSDDISKIIKAIDEIAFQTNILALNAAVEAARAGEAGMGFAVVAEEVRNLAQRAAQAARDTTAKIEGSTHRSLRGVEVTGKVAASLTEIVTKAREVDALVAEIAQASSEQSEGIAQVNRAVAQIDQVTQQNTATSETGAASAEELNAQASMLQSAVHDLLALVGSEKATPAKPTIKSSSTPSRGGYDSVSETVDSAALV